MTPYRDSAESRAAKLADENRRLREENDRHRNGNTMLWCLFGMFTVWGILMAILALECAR